jgi:F0F1-type ATP synthase assembly protein I
MSEDKQQKGADWTQVVREAAPYLGLGTSLASTVLVALGGGYWLDGKLGTAPIFFLVGAVLGLLAASYHLYKMYRMMTDRKR